MPQKRIVEWNGAVWTLSALASYHGLDYGLLWQRVVLLKWPLEKALSHPIGPSRVTAEERLEAQQIIHQARQSANVPTVAALFGIPVAYVSFADHGHTKRTGKPYCPNWAIRKILERGLPKAAGDTPASAPTAQPTA